MGQIYKRRHPDRRIRLKWPIPINAAYQAAVPELWTVDGHARVRLTDVSMTVEAPPDGLLWDFIRLRDKLALFEFECRYGCADEWSPDPEALVAAVRIAVALVGGSQPRVDDIATLTRRLHWSERSSSVFRDTPPKELVEGYANGACEDAIDIESLVPVTSSGDTVDWIDDEWTGLCAVADFNGVLVRELFLALTGASRIAVCSRCNLPYRPQRMPQRRRDGDRPNFCFTCKRARDTETERRRSQARNPNAQRKRKPVPNY